MNSNTYFTQRNLIGFRTQHKVDLLVETYIDRGTQAGALPLQAKPPDRH
jgi:hypothetical protein